jgi:hypothetical protein
MKNTKKLYRLREEEEKVVQSTDSEDIGCPFSRKIDPYLSSQRIS